MFKLIKWAIIITAIASLGFIALSMESGGKRIRWFGDKFKTSTEKAGHAADVVKQTSETIRKGAGTAVETIKDTSGKIKNTTEKAVENIKKTNEAAKETSSEVPKKLRSND